MKTNVKIKKLNPNARVPKYQTDGAAAADLCACLGESVTVLPGERRIIPTGISLELEPGVVALIFARSGLATKKGLALANSVGVIDSDYRGEVGVAVINHSEEPVTIGDGERIAQMGMFPVFAADFILVDDLTRTERGNGGFGHTGVL